MMDRVRKKARRSKHRSQCWPSVDYELHEGMSEES